MADELTAGDSTSTAVDPALWDAWLGTADTTVGGMPVDWNAFLADLGEGPQPITPVIDMPAGTMGGGGVNVDAVRQALGLTLAGSGVNPDDVLNADAFKGVFVDSKSGLLVTGDGKSITPGDSIWKALDTALGSNLGRVAATLGLGAVGLGASRLAAGAPLRFPTVPGVAPTPVTSAARAALDRVLTGTGGQNLADLFTTGVAGQGTLANLLSSAAGRELLTQAQQAPGERAVRTAALEQLPGYLRPTPETAGAAGTTAGITRALAAYLPQTQPPIGGDGATMPATPLVAGAAGGASTVAPLSDRVNAAIEAQLMRALAGQLPNPEMERQFRIEEQQLSDRLFSQLGPNFANSTQGSMALQQLRESQDSRRTAYAMQAVATLAPLAQSRRSFNYQQPLSTMGLLLPEERARAGQAEALQQSGLATRSALSTSLGRPTTGELVTGLSSSVPIAPILGLGDAAAAERQHQALQAQAALTSLGLQAGERQSLTQGIGGLFGAAAGALTAPRRGLTLSLP